MPLSRLRMIHPMLGRAIASCESDGACAASWLNQGTMAANPARFTAEPARNGRRERARVSWH
jgi:hypothetical protein